MATAIKPVTFTSKLLLKRCCCCCSLSQLNTGGGGGGGGGGGLYWTFSVYKCIPQGERIVWAAAFRVGGGGEGYFFLLPCHMRSSWELSPLDLISRGWMLLCKELIMAEDSPMRAF